MTMSKIESSNAIAPEGAVTGATDVAPTLDECSDKQSPFLKKVEE